MITKRVQYRYDSVRNKIGMTDADGGLHTYTYDVMRRLTGVINPLGERTTYAYDLNGRRTSVQLANGTRTSYVYDVASRVQMVQTLKSDDSTVSKFEYEYDGNGRRTSVLEADGSRVTWTYDRISQVTAEWRTGTNPYRHTFTYDKCGNRTLKIEDGERTTLVYDACNQLLTSADNSGTTTFTYDGNGNQTVVQKPNGDRTTQIWDYENRLIKTIQPSGGVTSMAYDADGLRLKLEEPTGTKLFVWDDQNYLAETDAAGATQAAFTTEPSTYGGLISHRKAGSTTTYHFDALGSTRALTDVSEAVQERYNYTAFGTLLGSPTLLTPFLWGGMVGYYWDAALATQYIRARHYQPTIARWISLDPIGFAGGDANLFRYVGNSPTSGGTERRVKLTAMADGQWQLAIARSVLENFALAYTYPRRERVYAGWSSFFRVLDPSGLVGDCCCCCPISLTAPTKLKYIKTGDANGDGIEGTEDGHFFRFDVITKIELKLSGTGNGTGCDIEWQECANSGGNLGQKPGVWFKVDPAKGRREGNWDDYKAGKLNLKCPGGMQDLTWGDTPNLNEQGQTKIIRVAVRVSGDPGCECNELEPIFFTFKLMNYTTDFVGRPQWDNKGKEIEAGIDENEEPKGCSKRDLKAWGSTAK